MSLRKVSLAADERNGDNYLLRDGPFVLFDVVVSEKKRTILAPAHVSWKEETFR